MPGLVINGEAEEGNTGGGTWPQKHNLDAQLTFTVNLLGVPEHLLDLSRPQPEHSLTCLCHKHLSAATECLTPSLRKCR